MLRQISVFVSLVCIALPGFTQSDWQFSKEKKGIRVYTKSSDSSSFKAVKVEGVFEGSWEKLSAILMDVKNMDQWVYHTTKSYVIKKVSASELIYYTETILPWPINNRYTIVHMKLTTDGNQNTHKVVGVHEPNFVIPKTTLIRTSYYRSLWEVKTLSKNKISIVFIVDINPGGSLPPWVVNMFITAGPFETFTKLGDLLKK